MKMRPISAHSGPALALSVSVGERFCGLPTRGNYVRGRCQARDSGSPPHCREGYRLSRSYASMAVLLALDSALRRHSQRGTLS